MNLQDAIQLIENLRAEKAELARLLVKQLNPATRENVPCWCPSSGQPHGVNQSSKIPMAQTAAVEPHV